MMSRGWDETGVEGWKGKAEGGTRQGEGSIHVKVYIYIHIYIRYSRITI